MCIDVYSISIYGFPFGHPVSPQLAPHHVAPPQPWMPLKVPVLPVVPHQWPRAELVVWPQEELASQFLTVEMGETQRNPDIC